MSDHQPITVEELEKLKQVAAQIVASAREHETPAIVGAVLFLADTFPRCLAEIERLRAWVNDLQSGMYVNCVYCGLRYGPSDRIPASRADALKAHVEKCSEHPMSKLQDEVERLRAGVRKIEERLTLDESNARLRDGGPILASIGIIREVLPR